MELPGRTLRAGKVLGFDAAGRTGAQKNIAVASVFGRTGDVLAAVGDFLFSQIANDIGLSGSTVEDVFININTGRTKVRFNHNGEDEAVLKKDTVFNKEFGGSGKILELAGSDHNQLSPDRNNNLLGKLRVGAEAEPDYEAVNIKDVNSLYLIIK